MLNRCEEEKEKCEKIRQFSEAYILQTILSRFSSNLVCKVVYMEGIKCVNLIEIGPVVIEIRGVKNDDLVVPVNNILVFRTSFLAADTRPCVLTPLVIWFVIIDVNKCCYYNMLVNLSLITCSLIT